ncbi:MAG TPA: SH3 domain-containing protein [Gemmatimonadales bacterium]|nr:SH3 domain-containing protein [Gemmatimonadales bacterium]
MASCYPVLLASAAALALAACSHSAPEQVPTPNNHAPLPVRVVTETVTVRDRDLEQRVARLQLQLLDRDALVEDLQARLDAASRDAVRSMAKVQTLATRAEAASGMAEAQIVLQTLRRTARGSATPELARATKMLSDAASEFDHQNYGGALYLANQAKGQATVGRRRVSEGNGDPSAVRPGESMFAVPLALRTTGRCNLRDGPGSTFKVLATLDGGVQLTGISYADQWMRVVDDNGREGWVFWTLVQKRGDAGGAVAAPGR